MNSCGGRAWLATGHEIGRGAHMNSCGGRAWLATGHLFGTCR
jgi:hypothetical protein